MLRMEYGKEVVLSIHHCIEIHEQRQLPTENDADEDCTEETSEHSHVHLGSRRRGLKVPSYEKVLEETVGLHGFSDALARFLRDYARVEVYGSDFEGDGL